MKLDGPTVNLSHIQLNISNKVVPGIYMQDQEIKGL